MLIPRLQLCLAHYCDLHGPTPLMVTEGLPVPCGTCRDDGLHNGALPGLDRPRSSSPTSPASSQAAAVTDALRRMDFAGAQRSSSVPASEQEAQAHVHRGSLRRAARAAAAETSGTAIETPPQSPRLPAGHGVQQPKPRQDSGYRRTYDDYVTRRAGPCDNCALTLPKRQQGSKDAGAGSQPERGPTLRTRAPCARVFTGVGDNTSPPISRSSSSVPSEDESTTRRRPSHSHRRTGTAVSLASRSSGSSTSATANVHTHLSLIHI